jgi:pyrroloquinoline quinone biosynthesis protein D
MPDPNAVPIPRQGFQLEELDGETLLYRHSEKRLVYLNESAALVWKLCDGKRTAREITSLLVDAYPEARETIAADVAAAIESLVREGVLRTSSQPEEAA